MLVSSFCEFSLRELQVRSFYQIGFPFSLPFFLIIPLFSFVALCLSVYAVSNQYYADIPTAVLSLVGVCSTLIVGISVVDAFAVHSAFHKMEGKVDELSKKMEELTKQEEKIRKLRKQANILFHHTWGLVYANNQPYDALNEFWKAFTSAAKDNDVKRAKVCLENTESTIEDIMRQKEMEGLDERKISLPITDELKQTSVYVAFEDRINELLKTSSGNTKFGRGIAYGNPSIMRFHTTNNTFRTKKTAYLVISQNK